jgi:hypothetical protein
MKTTFKLQFRLYWPLILSLVYLFSLAPLDLMGQKKERTRLKAYYEQLPNSDKKISIILTQGRGKDIQGVQDALISLSTAAGDSTYEITTVSTDALGESLLRIENGYLFPINEEGYSVIELKYSGNDSLRGSSRKIEFQDLKLDLKLEMIDSVKTVNLAATMSDADGKIAPVEDLKVKIGVKRLLSNLYLEEVQTDEEGIASFEFPNDIPGDSIGMINVVARIEDHSDFGTVSKIERIDWGTPVNYSSSSSGRSLYGDSAPIWMITSVAIILGGAWLHFLWALITVFRIKKLA